MRAILMVGLLAAMTLAGCADTPDEPTITVADEPDAQYTDDSGFQVDVPSLPREPPLPGERDWDVPQWRLGEWWQYRITDHFEGNTYDVTRVVAGTEHGNYLVGFPLEDFNNDVMILHVPGYGDINATDLSYDAHDVPYAPLRFPLREGDSWVTQYEAPGNTLTFVVDEVNETTGIAKMTAAGGQGAGTFEYNREMGEISRWIAPGYADYEIVDHGYNYTGAVRVPHDHDLIFFHGRYAAVADLSQPIVPPTPVLPTETITIPEGYDRASFALILFDQLISSGFTNQAGLGGVLGVNTGYYSLTATAPDGTVYEETFMPGESGKVKITGFGHEDPTGDWTLQSLALGEGAALLEGIGYHSIDIELPSGCVIASANALHHITLEECK